MLNVVLTKVCSRIERRSPLSAGTEIAGVGRSVDGRLGEPDMISSRRGRSGNGGSTISSAARCRTASFLCRSALTRRKNGMLSCGRRSCEKRMISNGERPTPPKRPAAVGVGKGRAWKGERKGTTARTL